VSALILPEPLQPAPLLRQARGLLPVFALIYIPVLAVLAGMFAFWLVTGKDTALLTRDPLAIVETELLKIQRDPDLQLYDLANLAIPLYAGIVSNLGILLWTAAAAVSAFAWLALRRTPAPPLPPAFFLGSALVSSLLMLDDFFLIHERWVPILLGIAERFVFAVYGMVVLYYLSRWRHTILRTEFLLLAAAFAGFALSLSVDAIPDVFSYSVPQIHFFEDGSKFAGVAAWAGYHVRTALMAVRGLPAAR
jgi:hypothetical protein